MMQATKEIPFFNCLRFLTSENFDGLARWALGDRKDLFHFTEGGAYADAVNPFVMKDYEWLGSCVIDTFFGYILRDIGHPIHKGMAVMPLTGLMGRVAMLTQDRTEERIHVFKTVNNWLRKPANLAQMYLPILIVPTNLGNYHWVLFVFFNPLSIFVSQENELTGYMILDSTGPHGYSEEKKNIIDKYKLVFQCVRKRNAAHGKKQKHSATSWKPWQVLSH